MNSFVIKDSTPLMELNSLNKKLKNFLFKNYDKSKYNSTKVMNLL
jgi:hypothetical protein